VLQLRKARRVGYVARKREMRNAYIILVLGIDWRKILKWILKK
jgi:hypothetical protein